MNAIGSIILAGLIWFWVQYEITAANVCSQFTQHPAECNSDKVEEQK